MDWRINVVKSPFIGWNLTVRMQITMVQEQFDLILSEIDIKVGENHAVISQIPGCEPWVLPAVRHGNNVIGS